MYRNWNQSENKLFFLFIGTFHKTADISLKQHQFSDGARRADTKSFEYTASKKKIVK